MIKLVRSVENNLTFCVENAAKKCLTVVRRSDMLSSEKLVRRIILNAKDK